MSNIEIIKKELDTLISEYDGQSLSQYRYIAAKFQVLVENVVESIWSRHNNKISMQLNGVDICLEHSTVNTSTAIGYVVEEFLVRQFPSFLIRSNGSTINVPEDAYYSNDKKILLMVNLKVEKNTSKNNGIVAGNILQNKYLANSIPKLYLILKSKYNLDENQSDLLFNGTESYYLESFITDMSCLKSDSRNWSEEFKVLSGRLQSPNKNLLMIKGINSIPNYNEIHNFIEHLSDNLIKAKETRNL